MPKPVRARLLDKMHKGLRSRRIISKYQTPENAGFIAVKRLLQRGVELGRFEENSTEKEKVELYRLLKREPQQYYPLQFLRYLFDPESNFSKNAYKSQ